MKCCNSFDIDSPDSTTEEYKPVNAKWTTERCAVCRWVEDWDYNKIIICNRFFYGHFLFY